MTRGAGDQTDAVPHERRFTVVRALERAALNGKQVTVLVELTARFDEERNIEWAKRLDQAGAHVIYGLVITRRTRNPADCPPRAARPASLRAFEHRQLQRSHRAPLHGCWDADFG